MISSVEGDRITIGGSLVNAIEMRWGGGRGYLLTDDVRPTGVGIENLRAISFWTPNQDGVDDTRHADRFLVFDNIRDSWVRKVTAEHFFSLRGAFSTGRNSLGITMEDCSTLIADRAFYAGPGYDSSGRTFGETGTYVGRYGFYFGGQNGLVRRCYALNNRHAFVVNSRVNGPNVFSDCQGEGSLTYSEPHHRWSTGGHYDHVADIIVLMNRLNWGSGHGWAGANYVAWNTTGDLVCEQPPTAQNWAIGTMGRQLPGRFHESNLEKFGTSFGYWESQGRFVNPRSLYSQQLEDRGKQSMTSP